MRTSDDKLVKHIEDSVRGALAEDIGAGDLTAGLVPAGQQARATVIIRDPAVVCGIDWFNEVFAQLDARIIVDWMLAEGDTAQPQELICALTGPARPILTGERTALNFLQTLSATATAAAKYVDAIAGTRATILDTRKTLPGLRLAQKYAVATGGAANHRTGLYDGILIKENHIAAGGGITKTVAAALAATDGVLVEVEVETLAQAQEAIEAGAHRLLIDNFDLPQMCEAVTLRDQSNPAVTLEASGGVNLDTVRAIAETGVDFISVGSLTKDVKAVDLSMRFEML
jgi:nicotinate-nucleotide pyrophosphorylase (carboxylating)